MSTALVVRGESTPDVKIPADIAAWSDKRLDKWINKGVTACGTHAAGYATSAIRTGRGLEIRRDRLPYGEFDAWVQKNFDGSRAQAKRYVRAAESAAASGLISPLGSPVSQVEVASGVETDLEVLDGEVVEETPDFAVASVKMYLDKVSRCETIDKQNEYIALAGKCTDIALRFATLLPSDYFAPSA